MICHTHQSRERIRRDHSSAKLLRVSRFPLNKQANFRLRSICVSNFTQSDVNKDRSLTGADVYDVTDASRLRSMTSNHRSNRQTSTLIRVEAKQQQRAKQQERTSEAQEADLSAGGAFTAPLMVASPGGAPEEQQEQQEQQEQTLSL